MDGSPCFLEPLVNVTIKEGSKFRIACSIAGFPQPKVIWYHNKGILVETRTDKKY